MSYLHPSGYVRIMKANEHNRHVILCVGIYKMCLWIKLWMHFWYTCRYDYISWRIMFVINGASNSVSNTWTICVLWSMDILSSKSRKIISFVSACCYLRFSIICNAWSMSFVTSSWNIYTGMPMVMNMWKMLIWQLTSIKIDSYCIITQSRMFNWSNCKWSGFSFHSH